MLSTACRVQILTSKRIDVIMPLIPSTVPKLKTKVRGTHQHAAEANVPVLQMHKRISVWTVRVACTDMEKMQRNRRRY